MNKKESLLPPNDIHRRILHLDMDAFYASVEMRDHPSWRDKAVIVGQDPRQHNGHGVVATANYLARRYGVHSAMPSIQAVRLIPPKELVIVPPHFAKYRAVSAKVHQMMHEYTDLVQSVALDEAYLDVTRNKKKLKSALSIALALQERVYHDLHLTCSFGVSYNKFLAKMGSEYAKPFGRTVILPEEAKAFLAVKKNGAFPGIGPKTQHKMQEMGLFTGADLQKISVRSLIKHFGKMGYVVAEHAAGIDLAPVVADDAQKRKSIGIERTFEPPLHDVQEALSALRKYAQNLSQELSKRKLAPATIVLKIRDTDFITATRRVKLRPISAKDREIYEAAANLFETNVMDDYLTKGIRLLGLSVTDFSQKHYQETSLF